MQSLSTDHKDKVLESSLQEVKLNRNHNLYCIALRVNIYRSPLQKLKNETKDCLLDNLSVFLAETAKQLSLLKAALQNMKSFRILGGEEDQQECKDHQAQRENVFPEPLSLQEMLNRQKSTHIIRTNLLTKFHEDRKIKVVSRVLTRKNAPPLGSHVFQAKIIIFKLIQDIIETNLLTKFHEDWTINVASRVLTSHIYWKNAPPPGGHVFKATKTIFKLIQDIIWTNLLTKFHDHWKINVTSRVLTRKNATPPWWPYIIGMNLLTEFHENQTINVASRVKNVSPLGSHVFQANTNLLTKFHEDWTINVASRVKNAPPLGSHVFSSKDIIGTNLLSKFHEDRKINVASRKTAPPLGGHVFSPIWTILKLVRDINETNVLTKFHDDWAKIVTSRVFTRNTATPPGGHVFQRTRTIFELNQHII
ncbi:hypothetical protein DPMN_140450 [Dreissena polymorpha]|uniref:Uncharacterized protein n=1 Tax=Dreissena polymorpha TaxID=45954 RepID=A0A9D4JJ14_DREPO|nr:hypothetical protein DPMN_140450 [Dreissena polymorpha]